MAGRELQLRADFQPTARQLALRDCFRIFHPEDVRRTRSFETETWKSHSFKNIVITGKGAGGVGKTTTTAILGFSTVLRGQNCLIANLDGQDSIVDRLLGKLVYELYEDDMEQFLQLNGFNDQARPANVLQSLKTVSQNPHFRIIPPLLVSIDVVRLASSNDYTETRCAERLFLMLGDEDISDWDQQLAEGSALMHFPTGDVYRRTFGAYSSLMHICAYVTNSAFVYTDLGPGNGRLNRLATCCCHGFFMPQNIDSKANLNISSMARKLPQWLQEHNNLRNVVNIQNNPYPLPEHVPKFLGVIMHRLGARGSVRPYNQFTAWIRCNHTISMALMPVVTEHNMALPPEAYENARQEVVQTLAQVGAAGQFAPPVVPGTVGVLRDFDQLQHMSERESVPVPFLHRHHFRTLNGGAYEQVLLDQLLNNNAPLPHQLDMLQDVGNAAAVDLATKVANIRRMTDVYVMIGLNHLALL
mmetsp:Transcript_34943/g.77704  ORF Transcript_34943/g.77704 Transcript_34943/m.77704 type:complete len:472 (+) Transcript_34943:127-1542(+)|eukprot:CAMPEP_0202912374 /NCGR_PEP_ID=MMETSP1392-20130828/57591_1 /ASSEMBLY_ACC=CAM_ASM_000868 /TAXON_ID=225041 /ORGANISM="Chlamydomonas chlamydogama, Strain SAG 11-48b" /LENGTH=471 /DNA_ID=CAMNT_0049603253 /DNA_START=100 /DNA_END=1515 /DNA_ORIENTATION=+